MEDNELKVGQFLYGVYYYEPRIGCITRVNKKTYSVRLLNGWSIFVSKKTLTAIGGDNALFVPVDSKDAFDRATDARRSYKEISKMNSKMESLKDALLSCKEALASAMAKIDKALEAYGNGIRGGIE